MDNTITALQALYVALGGTASDVADIVIIPDMINAIATLVAGGLTEALPAITTSDEGKVLTVNSSGAWEVADVPTELPTVTADDNGDVLTVVEGAWAAAAAEAEGNG